MTEDETGLSETCPYHDRRYWKMCPACSPKPPLREWPGAARRADEDGLRAAAESVCRYWWDQPRPGVDLHSIGMWDLAEKIRRAAEPGAPEASQ